MSATGLDDHNVPRLEIVGVKLVYATHLILDEIRRCIIIIQKLQLRASVSDAILELRIIDTNKESVDISLCYHHFAGDLEDVVYLIVPNDVVLEREVELLSGIQ